MPHLWSGKVQNGPVAPGPSSYREEMLDAHQADDWVKRLWHWLIRSAAQRLQILSVALTSHRKDFAILKHYWVSSDRIKGLKLPAYLFHLPSTIPSRVEFHDHCRRRSCEIVAQRTMSRLNEVCCGTRQDLSPLLSVAPPSRFSSHRLERGWRIVYWLGFIWTHHQGTASRAAAVILSRIVKVLLDAHKSQLYAELFIRDKYNSTRIPSHHLELPNRSVRAPSTRKNNEDHTD